MKNFRVDGFPKDADMKHLSIMHSTTVTERPEFSEDFQDIDIADQRIVGKIIGLGQVKVFDACKVCFKSMAETDVCKTCKRNTKTDGYLVSTYINLPKLTSSSVANVKE